MDKVRTTHTRCKTLRKMESPSEYAHSLRDTAVAIRVKRRAMIERLSSLASNMHDTRSACYDRGDCISHRVRHVHSTIVCPCARNDMAMMLILIMISLLVLLIPCSSAFLTSRAQIEIAACARLGAAALIIGDSLTPPHLTSPHLT